MEARKFGSRWQEIDSLADDLRRKVWKDRDLLWEGVPPADEVHALEPGVALHMLGYQVRSSDFLGIHNFAGKQTEVAGQIDRERKIVEISCRFPTDVQLFTAAHETAHVVLHPDVQQLHRDIAVSGADMRREWREQEADRFAACFLMPADLVELRFLEIFGVSRFELTDDSAFALCGTSLEKVLRTLRSQRDLSRRLAQANFYWGVRILPLNQIFGVSITAMAIRLEELNLVGEVPGIRFAPPFLKR